MDFQGHGHKVLAISVSHVNAHQILGAMERSKNNQVEKPAADKATLCHWHPQC